MGDRHASPRVRPADGNPALKLRRHARRLATVHACILRMPNMLSVYPGEKIEKGQMRVGMEAYIVSSFLPVRDHVVVALGCQASMCIPRPFRLEYTGQALMSWIGYGPHFHRAAA